MEQIKSPYYRLSVKAKIRQGNRLVLVKEDHKAWDLPGGGIEHRETIEEGLKRELAEELGLDEIPANLGQPKIFKMIHEADRRPLLFLVYEFEISPETKLTPAENVQIGYFAESDLPTLDTVAYSLEYGNFIKTY